MNSESSYDDRVDNQYTDDDGSDDIPPPRGSSSPHKDEKDMIIAKQRKMMQEMQKEFAATLDSLRAQLNDYISQSSQVQSDMVDRIRELKTELAQLRKKSTASTTRTSQTVRSSLYSTGAKHPRKLAQGDDVRRSRNRP